MGHFVFDTKLVEFYGVLRVVSCQGIGWYRSGIKGSFLYWRFNSPWFHLWRFDETVLFCEKNTFLEDAFLNEKQHIFSRYWHFGVAVVAELRGLFLLATMNPSKSHHFQHSPVIKGYPYWLHEKASFLSRGTRHCSQWWRSILRRPHFHILPTHLPIHHPSSMVQHPLNSWCRIRGNHTAAVVRRLSFQGFTSLM